MRAAHPRRRPRRRIRRARSPRPSTPAPTPCCRDGARRRSCALACACRRPPRRGAAAASGRSCSTARPASRASTASRSRLARREFALLAAWPRAPGRVFTKAELDRPLLGSGRRSPPSRALERHASRAAPAPRPPRADARDRLGHRLPARRAGLTFRGARAAAIATPTKGAIDAQLLERARVRARSAACVRACASSGRAAVGVGARRAAVRRRVLPPAARWRRCSRSAPPRCTPADAAADDRDRSTTPSAARRDPARRRERQPHARRRRDRLRQDGDQALIVARAIDARPRRRDRRSQGRRAAARAGAASARPAAGRAFRRMDTGRPERLQPLRPRHGRARSPTRRSRASATPSPTTCARRSATSRTRCARSRRVGEPATPRRLLELMDPRRLELLARSGSRGGGRPAAVRLSRRASTRASARGLAGPATASRSSPSPSSAAGSTPPPGVPVARPARGSAQRAPSVYFCLEADRLPLLARMLAAAIVGDLLTVAAACQADPVPTLVAIDEFSAIAPEASRGCSAVRAPPASACCSRRRSWPTCARPPPSCSSRCSATSRRSSPTARAFPTPPS